MTELIVHASSNILEPMVHEDKARKEFSKRLALACKNAGLPPHGQQAEIARKLGVTPKAVSKWFNGETIPRRNVLKELSSFLGTASSYLLGDEDEDRYLLELTARQRVLLELFDELPSSEADDLLKTLEEKKWMYRNLYKELDEKKKKRKAS
ncbi:helix-turn-helix domain-containing protein [Salmonella enterica]|nr:helix-turn-helix domain-containing protein [Salmonella enterica]EAU7575302.1 helix-turn-helix domain-containing protein [Salmonella enterica]